MSSLGIEEKVIEEEDEGKRLICTICPLSCEISVQIEGERVIRVEGHRCPKGREHAKKEALKPLRTLTTIVKVSDGRLPVVSAKTVKAIPKDLLFKAIKSVSRIRVKAPVKAGDILVKDLLGLGIPLTATNNVSKKQ